MNRALSAEYLTHVTKFERFLIVQKGKLILASFVAAFAISFAIMPSGGGSGKQSPHNARMQTTRQIGQMLFSYAQDHNGKYPIGKSSTDIFQQLLDQQYANDGEFFYFDMPGKTKATTNKLKPENVCFDITNGVLADDSDSLPVVFSTGFKIDYVPGGKAHLLANGDSYGIAVFFKGNNAAFLRSEPDGIPLFPPKFNSGYNPPLPNGFDTKGRTYQQLTPDGPLP